MVSKILTISPENRRQRCKCRAPISVTRRPGAFRSTGVQNVFSCGTRDRSVRFVGPAAILLGLLLVGCAGPERSLPAPPRTPTPRPAAPNAVLQCAPYARAHSRIKIFGDAYTWWDQAKGRYARRLVPTPGAVMVLYQYAGPNRAHVAVVRSVGRHELRIDHANWLNDGDIFLDDPVRDASGDRSWGAVNVFNMRTGHWGTRQYAVQGFIGPDGPTEDESGPALISEWLRRDRAIQVADSGIPDDR